MSTLSDHSLKVLVYSGDLYINAHPFPCIHDRDVVQLAVLFKKDLIRAPRLDIQALFLHSIVGGGAPLAILNSLFIFRPPIQFPATTVIPFVANLVCRAVGWLGNGRQ
jgi:hypothetical protein